MAKMGNLDAAELKKLQKQLNKIQQDQVEAFVDECAKELAARLLAKVIEKTPVGDYSREIELEYKKTTKNHKKGDKYTKRVNPSGKMGGTLRRGWAARTHEEAATGQGKGTPAAQYANSLTVQHNGDMLRIDIINPVEYASYVEFGHRTRNHKGWVPGRFMLTISEQELQTIAPKVLQDKIKKFIGGCMKP